MTSPLERLREAESWARAPHIKLVRGEDLKLALEALTFAINYMHVSVPATEKAFEKRLAKLQQESP